jgi:hypothetical protein
MKYDLTEVDKLFKELGYGRYRDYTDLILYIKISSRGDYKVTTSIYADLLFKELSISTHYNRDWEVPITIGTKIEPELYKAIDLLLKTVGII